MALFLFGGYMFGIIVMAFVGIVWCVLLKFERLACFVAGFNVALLVAALLN
jgi:hypothetical protein